MLYHEMHTLKLKKENELIKQTILSSTCSPEDRHGAIKKEIDWCFERSFNVILVDEFFDAGCTSFLVETDYKDNLFYFNNF